MKIMGREHILLLLLIHLVFCQSQRKSPEIAIIGGGIAGASASYFLHKLFSTPQFDADINVYEKGNIGGRLHTIRIADQEYEAGGSVIHSKNKYMVDFTKMLGLTYETVSGDMFGLYDGKEYVFKESEWHFLTILKMVWRYGTDIYRLKTLVNRMIDKLSRIYTRQDEGYAYTTVEKLLNAMDKDFASLNKDSIASYLRNNSYSERLISELTEAAMRTNYGQSGETLPGFVGLVSLAGLGYELWHVKEGNFRVPEFLLKRSNANIMKKNVTMVELTADGQFILTDLEGSSRVYDIVVIAAPLTQDLCNIKFKGFPQSVAPVPGKYHQTVATFVQGTRNMSTVNLKDSRINSILTTAGVKLFSSFSLNSPVNAQPGVKYKSVYKIFSQTQLTESELDELFTERHETKVVSWLAYPDYRVLQPLGKFMFDVPNLYYTNAIENSASAMEMSAISGRNVALLAYNKWHNKHSKIDVISQKKEGLKNEL